MGFVREQNELGSGGYGKVVIARDDVTGERVAAKIISTARMKRTAIEKEVKLMQKLNHKYIIGIRGTEEEGRSYIIYMELAAGGELFSRVISSGSLTEKQARPYFDEIMQAVGFMHANGVVHRDLKLENILLDAQGHCKVCDFGLAHIYEGDPVSGFDLNTKLREVCGSKSYCAPEVLEGRGYIGFPTDVWSCGICLFAMLAGFFPLDEASGGDWRFERVRATQAANQSTAHVIFGFYERPCTLSPEVTALIDGMMTIPVDRRLTVAEAVASPWLAAQPPPAAMQYGQYDGSNVYRGANIALDDAQLRELLNDHATQPTGPVYRAIPGASDTPLQPAPGAVTAGLGLARQNAFDRRGDFDESAAVP